MSDLSPPPPPPPTDDVEWTAPEGSRPDAPYGIAKSRKGVVTLWTGHPAQLAGRGARLGARLIDMVVVVLGMFIMGAIGIAILSLGNDPSDVSLGMAVLVPVAIGVFGYEVAFIAIRGQTLGKKALHIRVIRTDNGGVPGWRKSLGRWGVPFCINLIPFIGQFVSLLVYLSLTWDSRRQGWHDKAAGTFVVKA